MLNRDEYNNKKLDISVEEGVICIKKLDSSSKYIQEYTLEKIKIKNLVLGIAASAVITASAVLGVQYVSGTGLFFDEQEYNYNHTQVYCNERNFNLENLYILRNENNSILCHREVVDSKMVSTVTRIGNNTTVVPRLKDIYGYVSTQTGDTILVEGEDGYDCIPLIDKISYDVVEKNNFEINEDELFNLVPILNTKTK